MEIYFGFGFKLSAPGPLRDCSLKLRCAPFFAIDWSRNVLLLVPPPTPHFKMAF